MLGGEPAAHRVRGGEPQHTGLPETQPGQEPVRLPGDRGRDGSQVGTVLVLCPGGR